MMNEKKNDGMALDGCQWVFHSTFNVQRSMLGVHRLKGKGLPSRICDGSPLENKPFQGARHVVSECAVVHGQFRPGVN
jgi:hypothetical protein